jgi:hypothetical protein
MLLATKRLPVDQEWMLPAVRTLSEILGRTHRGSLVFVPGTGGLGDMGTIASVTLLEEITRMPGSEGETADVVVCTSDPLAHVLVVNALPDQDVRYVSPDRPTFSLAFTGEALRSPPALGVVAGALGAEAFLLSEALRRSGAIAVGGTTDVGETPFLVASCDLTLIGEELLLAGPLLSPGGCRAAALVHDRLKVLAWVLILVGVAAAKLGVTWYLRAFSGGGD